MVTGTNWTNGKLKSKEREGGETSLFKRVWAPQANILLRQVVTSHMSPHKVTPAKLGPPEDN